MDRNLLIAIVLSTLLMMFFFSPAYQQRFGRDVIPQEETSTETPLPQTAENKLVPEKPPVPANPTAQQNIQDMPVQSVSGGEEDTSSDTMLVQIDPPPASVSIPLENDVLSITVSTKGGYITNISMKQHEGPTADEQAQLVSPDQMWYAGSVRDGDITVSLSDILFTVDRQGGHTLVLSAKLSGNRTITREYKVDEEGYMFHLDTSLDGWDDPVVDYTCYGPVNDTEAPIRKLKIWPLTLLMRDDTTRYNKLVYLGQGDRITVNGDGKEKTKRIYTNEGSQKLDADRHKPKGSDIFTGDLSWYAIRNKYFMTAAIPNETERWTASASMAMFGDTKWYDYTISKKLSDGSTNLDIYAGPVSFDTLKAYDRNLTELMELSWRFIRPISIGFLWLLKKIHTVIPNWGVVVIVFSIFIKIVLYPLSHKSFVSMRRMSELQPQINELREKHKSNPQKLQQETMELYKREGVNPFSGCLPILFQMPVFFALYPVVGRAFELRQALFIPGWIEDLSRPDPYYILPIAMGISMFFQSKQTMKDPNQKAMLYVMPFMMVILFANFSSGLTLYWFLFNVMSYLQQTIHRHP